MDQPAALEALQHAVKDLASDLVIAAQEQDALHHELRGILRTMQTIAAQTTELTQRLNQYLDSAAREDGKVRQRLTRLEETLRAKR